MRRTLYVFLLVFVFLSPAFAASKYKVAVNKERKILEKRLDSALDNCRVSNKKFKNKQRCVDRVKIAYRKKFAFLKDDPESYFAKKQARLNRRSGSGNNGSSGSGSSRPGVIHTTDGRVLNRTGDGYTGPDGTFYSDAGGGIINTRTGAFIPTH